MTYDPHNDRIRWAETQAGVYDDEDGQNEPHPDSHHTLTKENPND